MRFEDRADAGRRLAAHLSEYARRPDAIVLALPRGGVPVAFELARLLSLPLDVFLVRKLGMPSQPEVAMGAIAEGGVEVLSEDLIAHLGIPPAVVQQVAVRERLELDRRDQRYRAGRQRPDVTNRTVMLVDDGLATGASMEAAILALRKLHPARILAVAPVGARETCERLGRVADRVVCLAMPEPFHAVGGWYADFREVADEEVIRLLEEAGRTERPAGAGPAGPAEIVRQLRSRVQRLAGAADDYDALLDGIGDARLVLLGEATHGTHEFYRERAVITKRLIAERGFSGVAVEADWPDAYRVNRYVRGVGTDPEAVDALADFQRFPTWMWRNADVLDFIGWLRAHNDGRPPAERAGFYGMDLYSLRTSTEAVLAYLDKVDPDAARRARARYGCFDQFGPDLQEYAYATGYGLSPSCEREVVEQLLELHQRRAEYASRNGRVAPDELFYAEQNARLVKNAEEYYRTMLGGRVESWNLRDRHMTATLRELLQFLDRTQPGSRLVVWAHNSHLGDARATEMGHGGELNVGQLARERFGAAATLVGFTTFSGTVTAASDWGGSAERKQVRPGLSGSYEQLFHEVGIPRFLVPLRFDLDLASLLRPPRLERAIGVIYAPRTERRSHYFHASLAEQFDFLLHFDVTRAVEPLERSAEWEAGDVAETFPSGL
jgi:erythromycin esterase-like protein/predicted phosphoribosyltransferase